MQKPLKGFGQRFGILNPGNWKIKYRLMVAGVALSILSLLAPMYMRDRLEQLSAAYKSTTENWLAIGQIHEFSENLTEAESKLRAFAASGNRDWIKNLPRTRQTMDALLSELWKSSGERPQRAALLKEVEALFRNWQKEIAARFDLEIATRPDDLAQFAKQMLAEPGAIRMHSLLNELSREIQDKNVFASRVLQAKSESASTIVTYGGVFFFVCFVSLVLSLWMTLIPDLNKLLDAARELKRGNLDHKVQLAGQTETATLARAFNEMSESLKAQNEKLKELNRLKSDFVSTVSHELRTPLTAIKGSIGLILGNVTGTIPNETAEMLKITQKNTDRLIRLINEVLDVAKIEAGAIQMRFDKFSLVDTIGHAVMGIEAFAQTQGINVVWEKPQASPLVVIDRDRIEQVVTNLLSNAIKFTEPGGTVTVKTEWEADRVVVQVSDTGQGIPEEFLERIFQKFQQAEGHQHKQKEGTGLGLTIAKAIIQEHGGSIWVTSKVKQGSSFFFALPWNGTEFVETPKKASTSTGAAKSNGHTILIADNEPDFTTVMHKLLEHEGYEVIIANMGQQCVELAIKHKPELVILDIMMPDMDGMAVRKVLSENPTTRDIPIVFVTVSPEMHAEAKKQADIKVISKPIIPDELKSWLKTFFAQRHTTAAPKKAA